MSVEEQNRFYPREQIGACPVCGSPVYESKRNFFCGNRECAFALWKREPVSVRDEEEKDGQKDGGGAFKGRADVCAGIWYSQKKGSTFAAYLCLDTEEGKASFRLEFPKRKTKNENPSRQGTGEGGIMRGESLPLRWRSSRFWHIGNGSLFTWFSSIT